jgi:phosphoenolpyruvate carboxykinase (ATP)
LQAKKTKIKRHFDTQKNAAKPILVGFGVDFYFNFASLKTKTIYMQEFGLKNVNATLESIGLGKVAIAHWNLSPAELIEETILTGEGTLTDTGALAIDTGEFTGRSPKDKFVVFDEKTKDTVWWGDVNGKFDSNDFDLLYNRVCAY